MKLKYNIVALAIFVVLCASFMAAFNSPDRMGAGYEYIDENGNVTTVIEPMAEKSLYKTYTLDTLANAANDTLAVPWTLSSQYQYCFQFKITNISGTSAIKAYLEQTNYAGSTEWTKVDSVTLAADPGSGIMKGANVWGNKYRLVVDGSGTQSTSYRASALIKPVK